MLIPFGFSFCLHVIGQGVNGSWGKAPKKCSTFSGAIRHKIIITLNPPIVTPDFSSDLERELAPRSIARNEVCNIRGRWSYCTLVSAVKVPKTLLLRTSCVRTRAFDIQTHRTLNRSRIRSWQKMGHHSHLCLFTPRAKQTQTFTPFRHMVNSVHGKSANLERHAVAERLQSLVD